MRKVTSLIPHEMRSSPGDSSAISTVVSLGHLAMTRSSSSATLMKKKRRARRMPPTPKLCHFLM
jgi:hypothetical protein